MDNINKNKKINQKMKQNLNIIIEIIKIKKIKIESIIYILFYQMKNYFMKIPLMIRH